MEGMPVRVDVRPEMLEWARDRAGLDEAELRGRFPQLEAWEQGDRRPTLRQLEDYARATRTPIGYLFLPEPPEEPVPIPDFRTLRDEQVRSPSPELLDTVALCQRRQEWYREYAQRSGAEHVAFVGSLSRQMPVAQAARAMREALEFGVNERGPTWTAALRSLIDRAENIGVLVMVNSIVGNNTHRALDYKEFRGFALADAYAPLVFVNSSDSKSAQIFTLAHELAHIGIGETALSDAGPSTRPPQGVERWCNEVAAEFLVPAGRVREEFRADQDITAELDRLARLYKVSTLVVLRRIHDVGGLSWDAFRAAYVDEEQRVREFLEARPEGGGGDFFNSAPLRASRRFARALIGNTLEGGTLYRDAFSLLAVRRASTFEEMASRLSDG
jgi:Zn-dependent peptidase ImmA (M78 family)